MSRVFYHHFSTNTHTQWHTNTSFTSNTNTLFYSIFFHELFNIIKFKFLSMVLIKFPVTVKRSKCTTVPETSCSIIEAILLPQQLVSYSVAWIHFLYQKPLSKLLFLNELAVKLPFSSSVYTTFYLYAHFTPNRGTASSWLLAQSSSATHTVHLFWIVIGTVNLLPNNSGHVFP